MQDLTNQVGPDAERTTFHVSQFWLAITVGFLLAFFFGFEVGYQFAEHKPNFENTLETKAARYRCCLGDRSVSVRSKLTQTQL
jgi:hypothetical protein